MVWKDKQALVLHSTHMEPLPIVGTKPYVHRKISGKKKKVRTGPMYLQYMQNLRGVDAIDQLMLDKKP